MPASNYDRYYHILDLKPGATLAEVQDSWRVLSQIWHPDRQPPGSKAYAKALEKQKQINDAYDRLKSLLQEGGSASGSPPPNTPPPKSSSSKAPPPRDGSTSGSPPPDWKWPPPGPGQSAGASGSATGFWQQSALAQYFAAPLVALFDLAEYRGQAVYDRSTGMIDYIPSGLVDKLRSCAIVAGTVVIYLGGFCMGGMFVAGKLGEYLLPGVEYGGSLGVIAGCLILYLVNDWLFGQVAIYKGTKRPVLQLYRIGETEAIQIIKKTLSDYDFQHYRLGNTSVTHVDKVVALEAPLTGNVKAGNKQNPAKLSLLGEIWPVEDAVLIKFTFLVKSAGDFRALVALMESLSPLLDLNLKQAGQNNQNKNSGK